MGTDTFVGRRDELSRFAALLSELVPRHARRGLLWPRLRPRRGKAPDRGKSTVVLVHGLGGTGKSRLLRHFQAMATALLKDWPVPPGRIRTAWLDWEDEQRNDPGKYTALEGPSLVTVMDAVQRAVTSAFGDSSPAAARVGQAFAGYRMGAARMPEYADRFAALLAPGGREAPKFTAEDAGALLRSAVSAGMVLGGHPGGILGLGPDRLAAAAQAGGHLSADAVRAVTGHGHADIPVDEYNLVTDPERELARRVAAAVVAAAGGMPLVVFLDTGEVIGERAWGWLRPVMAATGPTVTWVVGARFETEAEAGFDSPVAQFVRDIGDEHLRLMTPTRFDDEMIRTYMASRPGVGVLSAEQVDLIARFTRGLPLAVSFTATLLEEGQPVEEACRQVDDGQPSSVVSRLARRYLTHAEKRTYQPGDPRRDDLARILGLALAYADLRNDPDLLAALWDTNNVLGDFEDLARRHDFVLPTSRRLHDDVLITLRADLLDPFRRAGVRAINARALDLLAARLTRARGRWPDLDAQVGNGEYQATLLALLWHTLWDDNQAGLDMLASVLPVLVVADSQTARAAAAMTDQFADTFTPVQLGQLDLLSRKEPVYAGSRRRRRPTGQTVRIAAISMDALDLRSSASSSGSADLVGSAGDRQAAVHLLRGDYQRSELDDEESGIASLQAAATCATSGAMRDVIGSRAGLIANRLVWGAIRQRALPSDPGVLAAQIAATMAPTSADAWHTYAVALQETGDLEGAQAAYDKALAVESGNAAIPLNAGSLMYDLHRYEDALAAYDQALDIMSDYVDAHRGRGKALQALHRYEDALAAYDQALEIQPDHAETLQCRGHLLRCLGRNADALGAYGQALSAYREELAGHPSSIGILVGIGNVLYNLDRKEESLACYARALDADARNWEAQAGRGRALQVLHRYDEALAAYDEALACGLEEGHGHCRRGSVLHDAYRYDEALAAFDAALAAEPDRVEAHSRRGDVLRHLGRFEEALSAHDQALATDPSNPDALHERAATLLAASRADEALTAAEKALAIEPGHASAHQTRGEALAALGHLDEALACYDRSLEVDPRRWGIHAVRGALLIGMGRFQEGLAASEQALTLNSLGASAHTVRGFALHALASHDDEALAAHEQGLSLDPSSAIGHMGRGLVLDDMGRHLDALLEHDQAVSLDPRNVLAWTSRGMTLLDLGRPEEALADFDRALEISPGADLAESGRQRTLRQLGGGPKC